jgi:hypothetical protein
MKLKRSQHQLLKQLLEGAFLFGSDLGHPNLFWLKTIKGDTVLLSQAKMDPFLSLGLIERGPQTGKNPHIRRMVLTHQGESHALLQHLNSLPEETYAYA